MNKLLCEFTAVIDAPADRVADLVCAPGSMLLCDSGYVLSPVGPGKYAARAPGHTMTVESDVRQGFFAVQGGWWYRAEYQVAAVPGGARLTQRVYNAATWGRWAVPLANKFFAGFEARSRSQFEQLVAQVREAV